MRGLKKLLLIAALACSSMGLCLGNASATAETNDFNCQYAAVAKADSDYVYYGSTAVNTYTAEEAAAKGIPAGYENEVLEVIGPTSRGVLLDFTEQNIPFDLVDAIQFRIYLSTAAGNTGAYPQIRIPKPFAPDSWVLQEGVATPTGEWTTVTVPSTKKNFSALGENGILSKFELAVRSNATIDFYIDGISFVFKKPVINYTGGETISVALGKELKVSATAMDAAGNPLDLQHVWEDGVELNAKGTPAQVGEYALTLKAVDSYGGETTKTVTVVVSEEVVEEVSDFQCIYSVNPNKLLGGYGSSAVNTYTAEEAAAKGIPAGYKNKVVEVISIGSNSSNGLILDFSNEKIPLSLVEGLEFRVYISKNDKNTGDYPQLRIPDPNGSGNWVYQKNLRITDGEWTTFTIAKTSNFTNLSDAEGYLKSFELSMRSNGHVDFYIDSISCVLKADDGEAPVIHYNGEDAIEVASGSKIVLDVTASDTMEGNMPIEYIWQEGTDLDENGTPTQMGTYTLTLQSVDYFGNTATKTLTIKVTAKDELAPEIHFNLSEVKAKAGAKPMFTVRATDDRGYVGLTYVWSEGALDKRGCLTVGTHTWTITAVDASENTTTKTVTFIVTAEEPAYSFVTDEADIAGGTDEPVDPNKDTQAPVIQFNLTQVKVKAGAKPMFAVTATDDSGNVTLTKTWSEGALDKKGGLTVGTHTWTLTAVDPSGNKTTKMVTFIVTSDEPAYSYVTDEADIMGYYTVTFDGENAITVAYGFRIVKPADPVREDTAAAKYKFLGWYVGDKEWDFENDVVTGDLDIQSKWEATTRVYRVGFEGVNGTQKLEYGSLIPADMIPSDPTKAASSKVEYTFAGWTFNGELWDFENDVVEGEMTLMASWTESPRLYKVTFDGENEQLLPYGSKIEKPADPVKEATETTRYEFLGWFNGDKEWNFEQGIVYYNTNLQSKWREIALEGVTPETPDDTQSDSTVDSDSEVNTDSDVNTDSNTDTAKPGADNLLAGCSGVIGGVASGLTALGVAAYVLLKKKEN